MVIAPTERLKLRKQMAAAAAVNKLEVEEGLSFHHGHAELGGTGLVGKWRKGQQKAWRKQIFEVQTWRQVSGPAGPVACETRYLGIKWPQWHTLLQPCVKLVMWAFSHNSGTP